MFLDTLNVCAASIQIAVPRRGEERAVISDPVATVARSAASRLTDKHGPGLAADVEAALHARGTEQRPEQYVDPIALGGLLVSIASLAWTVYTTLRQRTPNPSRDVLARAVRVELRARGDAAPACQDQVTVVVITEIIRIADDSG